MKNDLPDQAVAALKSGRKIEAIKIVRETQGVGLKEAKEAIDWHIGSNPGAYPACEQSELTGGLWIFLVILILIGVGIFYWVG